MIFKLEAIVVRFDEEDSRQLSYVLEGPQTTKVLIATVPGIPHQYDLARSSNLQEAIADSVFSAFMDTIDSLRARNLKLVLGQEFDVESDEL